MGTTLDYTPKAHSTTHMQIRHTHAGFTLVELIVTISILTILGTIGFANFSGFQ